MITQTLSCIKDYFYKNRLAFIVTFIGGLLVHMYKFTNTLLGHDSLYNFYSSQNMIGSGRYLLGIFCGPTSFFDLPWINGIISVFLISISAVLIVDILHIENNFSISLTGLILVTFPSITETFFFEYTADGYMWAMLLCTLSVKFTVIENKLEWFRIITAILLIAVSFAVYQAYVSFALILLIVYFINDVLSEKRTSKKYLKWIFSQFFIYLSAVVLYFVVWKLLLLIFGMNSTSYLGISEAENGFSLIESIKHVFYNTFVFFFRWNIFEYGLTIYSFINILTIVCLITVITISIIKSKIYKKPTNFILVVIALFLIPFIACIWCFANPNMIYSPRMYQSFSLVYILLIVLSLKWIKINVKFVVSALMIAFVFNNSIMANLFYYYMNLANDRAKYTATELSTRIHLQDDGNVESVLIIGSLPPFDSSAYLDDSRLRQLGIINTVDNNLLSDNNSIYLYMSYYYNFSLAFYTEKNIDLPQIRNFESIYPSTNDYTYYFPYVPSLNLTSQQVNGIKNMRIWPHKDSVKKLDNIIVVKLSEENSKEEK